ncbi:uncharacterized protein srl [Plodia interpunctella]|uniref:uncharacterized protein srl n=1 Tax=Plodia interpunctella TaxID=58824 RepID=UPI0023678997|nr:uncharacterized protein LOC128680341 [Plodia interpunctella]
MDSHILNMYHQARYRTIGHKIMRSASNSMSSESSSQNSPEYKIQTFREGFSNGQDWCIENQQTNTTQSSHDTSSEDEEENIEVHEVPLDVTLDNDTSTAEVETYEDCSLVEGDDYDIIQVYTVHPDLDLEEASSEDDIEREEHSDGEYINVDDSNYTDHTYERPENRHPDVIHEGININLDTPVVSNVDEYFIKDTKNILETKDEPVVRDVDEYFIKEVDKHETPTVENFFTKHKYPDDQPFRIDHPVTTVPDTVPDNFLADDKEEQEETEIEPEPEQEEQENAEVSLNESDLEVLPNIEVLKKYLLEDMTCSKLKTVQKSCSVPHSPMNICMDIDDAKTCLSFEDLNLDLSDLAFDNDKDKSDGNTNKSDDIPRTLTDEDVNSFLITNKVEAIKNEDDLTTQDMEIEQPLETTINCVSDIPIVKPEVPRTSTPIPKPAVLEYCIEKTAIKIEPVNEIKTEIDDFVDVESCNDTVIPVLEANNLSSLLEQFEATEKLNPKKRPLIKVEEQKMTSLPKTSLTNGMRLQDAGVQLNKNKMRQILMPPAIKTVGRSPSPVHSDHDYCSSKKRHSLPNLKKGQSLLKPEVLSSNNRILNSRHRSCKNKKIVYNLSSDDESEKCINNNKNKKNEKLNRDDSDVKAKKNSVKPIVKPIVLPAARKKLYNDSVAIDDNVKNNNSVMNKSACKASDNPCSQNSNGSIKLTIKNKSEVILNCDDKDSQKDSKIIDKNKSSSVSDKISNSVKSKSVKEIINPKEKGIKELDSNKSKPVNNSENICASVKIKEEPKSKDENFYTALFSNKQDVQIPQSMHIKSEKLLFEEELQRISEESIKKELEQPAKKKKLNLQEYKMRRVNSNNSSATVSPESIFPEMPHLNLDRVIKPTIQTAPAMKSAEETPKEVFDPIREASRKIIMITKKQKAEAMRKRDEDIVMSKIPKVENLQLQPLMTDAEMMKMVGMTPAEELPPPIEKLNEQADKPQAPSDYEEIILVSIGTNTDERTIKRMEKATRSGRVDKTVKSKSASPPVDAKSLVNFKIKKSHVLKQNVFDNVKSDKKSPVDEKKHAEPKIDRERYKDITAALKSVEKHVNTKISSNSLFASIQDAVLKKAPEENEHRSSKPNSPTEKKAFEHVKTTIVREYDTKAEHGEDKIILHLEKDRRKPIAASVVIQTDTVAEFTQLSVLSAQMREKFVIRKRNDSDMSMSSEDSPVRTKDLKTPAKNDKVAAKPKAEIRAEKRSLSKEKRSRSKERYDKYRRRSRSPSRGRRRRKSYTRSRSRSRGRYRPYRRSDSPYKRKRRSRSSYRRRSSSRRSPKRRDRSNRSRTPRRDESTPARSPVPKKTKLSPHPIEKKVPPKSMTPPLRKPTISESSDSSTSSSSSSSSSSSAESRQSRESRKSARSSCSPYKREEPFKNKYRSFSSEDRESNTPVEERRIVFVGKLEKDINKTTLRGLFSKFGQVMEVRLHSKEDGTRYGFVTYKHARDAWSAVEAAASYPQYDVGFGGRRAFCRQSYADLDGLEAKYTESAFHGAGAAAIPARRADDLSFEEMLLEMKKKLSQRKTDKKRPDDKP